MKKIFTLFMFAVISLTASAYTGSGCFTAWYDTYGYFDQEWSNDGDVYTFKNFLNSGCDLVATITGEGAPAEYGGTQYSVTLSAPGTASYENGGYFYFCDANGYFAGLYPDPTKDYLVMCAYPAYSYIVKDDPTYGSYLCVGAYWDTAYSAWDYIYIYFTGADDPESINGASISQKSATGKFLSNGRVVVRRGNSLFDTAGKQIN